MMSLRFPKLALLFVLLALCLPLSAGIQYSGCTVANCLQNTTIAATDRPTLIGNLRDAVIASGWSVISGSGTTDVILQSASTPNSNQIQVRLYDSGEAAQAYLRNVSGTKVSQAFVLLVGSGKVYRFLGNKYQWFTFTEGSTVKDEYLMCSVPYVPTFLAASIGGDFGIMQSNHVDATCNNLRYSLSSSCQGTFSAITNNNSLGLNTGLTGAGQFDVVVPGGVIGTGGQSYRWSDDSLFSAEPLVAWGLVASTDERKVKGQFWDSVVISDSFAGDSIIQLDSRNWYAVTNNNPVQKGTLFVLVP
jgi:hypothetical protein